MKPLILALVLIFPMGSLWAQEYDFEYLIPEPTRPSLAPEFPDPPPREFRGLFLGMPLEDLKSALVMDSLFSFRGDRDVSFLPIREETLIETTGPSFIRRAHFQLSDEAVYIMSFTLDTRLMDHYSVFTTFVGRYGEPQILNPRESVWMDGTTRVSIERPLTVKYIDMDVFNQLVDESRSLQAQELFRWEEFLGDF
ncbi:MAG: hypothetical protein FWH12_09770 [Treponema sp.]|nr:hypothetical protein [Treponema sp.]